MKIFMLVKFWRKKRIRMMCVNLQAEARLAARQQARYEARNIRMRELEKKAKDEEEGGHVSSTNHSSLHSGQSSHFTAAYIQVSPHIMQQLIRYSGYFSRKHNGLHTGHPLFYTSLHLGYSFLKYSSLHSDQSSILQQLSVRYLFPKTRQLTLVDWYRLVDRVIQCCTPSLTRKHHVPPRPHNAVSNHTGEKSFLRH